MEFDFIPFDFMRMFIGDPSVLVFLLEIIVRVMVIFVFAVVLLRVISGKRLKDMSLFNYFLVVAMGSAAGDPMFYPTIPLIYGLVTLATVIILKEILTILTFKSDFLLDLAVPDPVVLVENGKLNEKILKHKRIPKKSFYSKLRIEGIKNIGEIEKCYLEPSGDLSIFKYDKDHIKKGEDIYPPEKVDDHDDMSLFTR